MQISQSSLRAAVLGISIASVISGCQSLSTHKPARHHSPPPSAPIAQHETYPAMPPAQNIIRLKEGQTLRADNKPITVRFDKVVSDDRCPLNSHCIWAGNATVNLTVTDATGKSQTLTLSSGDLRGDLVRRATVFGHQVSLETVYPTPTSSDGLQQLAGKYLIDVKAVPASTATP